MDLFNMIIKKADASGKPEDQAFAWQASRKFLTKYPKAAVECANLARRVETELLAGIPWMRYLGSAPQEMIEGQRRALGYQEASALERLLIDRLLACWLRVQQAELQAMAAERSEGWLKVAYLWDKRLSEANRTFIGAARALAFIRRKPMPSIVAQVNISAPTPETPMRSDPVHPRASVPGQERLEIAATSKRDSPEEIDEAADALTGVYLEKHGMDGLSEEGVKELFRKALAENFSFEALAKSIHVCPVGSMSEEVISRAGDVVVRSM
jgi:hypothetical protein